MSIEKAIRQNVFRTRLEEAMKANPNAHPEWVLRQVAKRCGADEDPDVVKTVYAQARRNVGNAYHAAPLSYLPAVRFHAPAEKPATPKTEPRSSVAAAAPQACDPSIASCPPSEIATISAYPRSRPATT